MCKKCQALRKVWWEKQKLCYDLLSERSDSYHVVSYEKSSAWKALWTQRNKHENRYYKVDVVQAFDILPERNQ